MLFSVHTNGQLLQPTCIVDYYPTIGRVSYWITVRQRVWLELVYIHLLNMPDGSNTAQ